MQNIKTPTTTRKLFFISHTHWDREWYEPFQVFRLRLVKTIDKLLDILARDRQYKFFMLDGQTVVLEDYLEVRPERAGELRAHIKAGRVLVGPWYILPDEFLVSGEAIVRNFLRGLSIAEGYGERGVMRVGYIPDPFGHISQMPQILRGFGLDTAVFRRGLADEKVELEWEGADGSRVFTIYLRDGYDNAAWLGQTPDEFAGGVERLRDSLAPHQGTSDFLLMNGTDHMEPWENLPGLIDFARGKMPDTEIIHSTLPAYIAQVKNDLGGAPLPRIVGELRDPKRHHLLPGVVSTRTWIKQRNMHAQMLLEKWAEPFSAYATLIAEAPNEEYRALAHLAWKYLLHNQPHDSICGCSVDQVHEEMKPRFDAVEQIANQIIHDCESALVTQIDTRLEGAGAAIVVFNPHSQTVTDVVTARAELFVGLENFALVDENGNAIPYYIVRRGVEDYFSSEPIPYELQALAATAESGQVQGMLIRGINARVSGNVGTLDITLSKEGVADETVTRESKKIVDEFVANKAIEKFRIHAHSPLQVELVFAAQDVPGCGYRTFYLRPRAQSNPATDGSADPSSATILENEFFHVEPDARTGALTVTDRLTHTIFPRVNQFVDGGDRGDLYNYNAPANDLMVDAPFEPPRIEWVERNAVRQTLRIVSRYHVPAQIATNRSQRVSEFIELPITTDIALSAGVRRIDFHTVVANGARDHRLRVHFDTPIRAQQSFAEQAFDVVARVIDLPRETKDWIEQPVGTKPMQAFMFVCDEKAGLMLASRGVPEYEVLPNDSGTTIALTLLRCTEWLSRADLDMRRGDAGPQMLTPGAQEIGTHTFDYALIPFGADKSSGMERSDVPDESAAMKLAYSFASPLHTIATDIHAGSLAASRSFVGVEPRAFVVTACKLAEDGEGIIVRGFNRSDTEIDARVKLFRRFGRAARVNLDEKEIAPLALNEGREVNVKVKAKEIVTLRFE